MRAEADAWRSLFVTRLRQLYPGTPMTVAQEVARFRYLLDVSMDATGAAEAFALNEGPPSAQWLAYRKQPLP